MNSDLLHWLDSQQSEMLRLVSAWANINSGTHNLNGLARLTSAVQQEFQSLDPQIKQHELPPAESIDSAGHVIRSPLGHAITFTKRPDAPVQVLLSIHLDTVYPPHHPFQQITRVDANTLRGPGVVDAKGGLVVMLFALRALERSDVATKLGWRVVLNPDEEIGSVGSGELLTEMARGCHAGLVFEPSLPDGSIVGARKGSGTFTVVVRGRAAHAGRDFHLGRSAIVPLAQLVTQLHTAQQNLPDVTINCGRIEGGGAVNVVPDLAIARFNARVSRSEEQHAVEQLIRDHVDQLNQRDGVAVHLHGAFHSPPKPIDARSQKLIELAQSCGKELGLNLGVHASGGACDGNRLAAAGLPVVDTLGPRGGHLHSDQEYLLIDSLSERAKLATLVLMRLSSLAAAPLVPSPLRGEGDVSFQPS
jgi:glutamate carboxypeptidase